jgi:hypothetical protein
MRFRAITSLPALFALLPALAHAEAQRFPADAFGMVEFMMPSGNIGCVYVPEGGTPTYLPMDGGPELICERMEPAYAIMILGPRGPAVTVEDSGEAGCCGGPVLAYGNHWEIPPFRCRSERGGLTCERITDGRGFSMARARIESW